MAIPIFNKRANSSADEYWKLKSLKGEGGKTKEQELEEIEKLLEKGIGGKLRDDLENRASQLRSEVMSEFEVDRRMRDVMDDILDATSKFAPNLEPRTDEIYPYDAKQGPIHEAYFRAITEILFGKADDHIEFDDAIISSKGIEIKNKQSDEIESLKVLNRVTMLMQESAKKKLGIFNQFDEAWSNLVQQDFAYRAFEMIVKSREGMNLSEIQDLCHRVDQEYQELVRDIYDEKLEKELEGMLSDVIWQNRLIERSNDGLYRATEFGRWMWELCKDDHHVKIEREPRGRSSLDKLKALGGFGRSDRDKKSCKVGGKWKL